MSRVSTYNYLDDHDRMFGCGTMGRRMMERGMFGRILVAALAGATLFAGCRPDRHLDRRPARS